MKITKISIFLIFIIQIGISNAQSETKIYEEISIEEKNFILKYQQRIKNETIIYKKDENHIIAVTRPAAPRILLDFLAVSHCAEFNKFAFRFKDSGKTRIFYNQIEAYYYRCSANIILKDSLSNSKVVWTNYDDKSFYKYPEKHLFLYRKKTKTFNKILKAAKKKIHHYLNLNYIEFTIKIKIQLIF